MNRPVAWYGRGALLGTVVVWSTWCPARAGAADEVTVQVWSIRATARDERISPELESLAETLKKSFKFKGYTLIKSETHAAAADQPVKWALPADYQLSITSHGVVDDKIKLDILISRREDDQLRKKLQTTLALKPEKFQLFGGWTLEDDDVLILAVSAK